MSLLLPLFLAGGLLLGVPIALHFLRSKPQVTQHFPTLRFLGPTAVRETRLHQLRRWLTLLLRCLIILLVCLAFSRPYWRSSQEGRGRAVIVAVDNSFSMQAKDRWQSLRSWADGVLAHLNPGDRAGILLMNPTPHWLVPLSTNPEQVRGVLSNLEPGYETTRYNAALRLAGDALAQSGARQMELVWMADEQQLGWRGVNFETPLPPGVNLLLPPVPETPKRQAAITRVHWASGSGGAALRVDVTQYLPAHDTRTLTVLSDGKPLTKQDVTLEAGRANSILIPLPGVKEDDNKALTVTLDTDDLPVDDTFYFTHTSDERMQVLVTPPEAGDSFDFISHAIDSTRRVASAPLKSEPVPDAEWPAKAVVIVRGTAPFAPPDHLDHFLKDGGVAWLFLNGSKEQEEWLRQQHLKVKPMQPEADAAPLHLRNWDVDHPLIAPLAESGFSSLLGINFYRGFAVQGANATPLATWEDGSTAVAEVSADGRRFLVCGFTFDRDSTDWPLKSSFVPFVHSALVWLSQQQVTASDWRVGDTIPLTGDGTWEPVDTPHFQAAAKVSGSVRSEWPGLFRFHSDTTPNAPARLYAINVRPEESDLTPWPQPETFSALVNKTAHGAESHVATLTLSREESENQQRLWWWLLALTALLLLAELRLANRTST